MTKREDPKCCRKVWSCGGQNRGDKQKSGDLRTPEGNFSVQSVQSAQGWSHDFHDGNGVIPNAYGPWFIRLKTGWSGIGIHGTHDPASIGKNVTEGCIRLENENLRILKEKYIRVGMPVIIERAPLKIRLYIPN